MDILAAPLKRFLVCPLEIKFLINIYYKETVAEIYFSETHKAKLSDLLSFLLINYFQIKTLRSQVTELAMAALAYNSTKQEELPPAWCSQSVPGYTGRL